VGHSPGQPTHGLHFLDLTQLFSQALAFHHLYLQLFERRGEFCRALLHPHFQGLLGRPQGGFGALAFGDFGDEFRVEVFDPRFFGRHSAYQFVVVET
jgi:hypothetical protein